MTENLISEERVKLALQHKEPDRVPFDLASTLVTGIMLPAYERLLTYLGITKKDIPVVDIVQQLAGVDENVLERLKVDIRGLMPSTIAGEKPEITEDNDYRYFTDSWGIGWKMPKVGGYYYDMYKHPLKGEIGKEKIDSYSWPNPADFAQLGGLREKAREFKEKGKAIIVCSLGGGFFELSFWTRSFEDFYMDLAANPSVACYLMDELLEIRMAYWEIILKELGDYILVVMEGQDLGEQSGTMISPEMYRKYVKPREKKLFSYIKKIAPKPTYIFFHTCGSVYDVIPDLIEVGVDILNPVQVSAAKMGTARLKKEFGKELAFWGGGVDTQDVLPHGTPQQVKDEVRRRIEDLAPGGGFVFNTVHNIQADVPPENIMAMWEALQEYGVY
jgi:uroporphyrinogen decarboxylase